MAKLVVSVAVITDGVQPEVEFNVNCATIGDSIHIVLVKIEPFPGGTQYPIAVRVTV